MTKSLVTAFVLASIAITSFGGSAQSQPGCVKAPKDPIPCPYIAQAPQPKGK